MVFKIPVGKKLYFVHLDGGANKNNMDFPSDVVSRYNGDVAGYAVFPHIGSDTFVQEFKHFNSLVKNKHAILLMSCMPKSGWKDFNDRRRDELVTVCQTLNTSGRKIILRLAHEMNGDWYPYGKQAATYISEYRKLAEMIHEKAPLTNMMWSPNFCYDDEDSERYYPGDEFVDMTGLSLYWNANERGNSLKPPPHKFLTRLKQGNFLRKFIVGKPNIPFLLAETGLSIPIGGTHNLELASAQLIWLQQILKEMLTYDNFVGIGMFDLDKDIEKRLFSISFHDGKPGMIPGFWDCWRDGRFVRPEQGWLDDLSDADMAQYKKDTAGYKVKQKMGVMGSVKHFFLG